MKETKTQYRGYIMTSKPILYIVIPCYNEEKVLPITSEMFLEELNLLIAKDKISEKGGGKKFLSRPCSGYLLKVANKMFNEL